MHTFPYLRVLIIDNNRSYLKYQMEILNTLGFRDICAREWSDRIEEFLESTRFDLALVDYGCLDVIDMLARIDAARGTLVICTGFDRGPRECVKAIGAGADAFLDKPFSQGLLREVVWKIMNSEAGRRARIVPFPDARLDRDDGDANWRDHYDRPWEEGA